MYDIVASNKVRYQTAVFERQKFKYGKAVSIGSVSQSWKLVRVRKALYGVL